MKAVNEKQDWYSNREDPHLQEIARRDAARQARRIPWQRLLEARTVFVELEVFTFWVRSIIESEGTTPVWLAKTIEQRCPGFHTFQKHHREKLSEEESLLDIRLSEWIRNHVFADARREGWFDAVTFYAFRDPYFNRAWTYWEQCTNGWKQNRPKRYPSFEEWAELREIARTGPGPAERCALLRRQPGALVQTVWTTPSTDLWTGRPFTHWVRSPIEEGVNLPQVIV